MYSQRETTRKNCDLNVADCKEGSPDAARYQEVAASINQLLSAPPGADGDAGTHVLKAAYSLVQACVSCRADADEYRKVSESAAQVEKRLQEQLVLLLDLSNAPYLLKSESTANSRDAAATLPPGAGRITSAIQSDATGASLLAPLQTCGTVSAARSEEQDRDRAGETLTIYCLGAFRVFVNDRLVDDWPNAKSRSVFKYLVAHRDWPACRETLMETFWPNVEPESSRNSLNVAVYNARKALASVGTEHSFIRFCNGSYSLDSELHTWVDTDIFQQLCANARRLEAKGRLSSAAAEYQAAAALYGGDFLVDDRYDDWLLDVRRQLREEYIGLLTFLSNYGLSQGNQDLCVAACKKLLLADACNEAAHRQLMRCYAQSGHTHLAIRQYHDCVESLNRELSLQPDLETVQLFQNIRRHYLV